MLMLTHLVSIRWFAGLRRGQLSRTRAPYRKPLFIKVLQLRSLKVDANV